MNSNWRSILIVSRPKPIALSISNRSNGANLLYLLIFIRSNIILRQLNNYFSLTTFLDGFTIHPGT